MRTTFFVPCQPFREFNVRHITLSYCFCLLARVSCSQSRQTNHKFAIQKKEHVFSIGLAKRILPDVKEFLKR